MVGEQILVIEPDQALRTKLADYLGTQGYQVNAVEDGDGAIVALRDRAFDVVLTDGLHGLKIMRHVREVAPSTIVLIMTAHGTVRSAVAAFRSGAHDYLVKPFSLRELGETIANVIQSHRLIRENSVLRQEVQMQLQSHPLLVGKSQAIRELTRLILKVAPRSSNVLITGESGTGKELVARALHRGSSRPKGLFVPVNIAAMPKHLVESHLFGHVRGAFTGTGRAREGAFRAASGGTLFLDEIGELPLAQQAKLLRVLEEKAILPVGSDAPVKVDVRVVAATHRDLKQMVQAGTFREDLLFRLNVVNIHVPPLRERVEDIPLLVEHLISRYRRDLTKPVLGVDNEAMYCLMSYWWKGNARELSNVIERAMLLCEGDMIRMADLPAEVTGETPPAAQPTLKDVVEQFEYRHIAAVLESVKGNHELAAKALGLSLSTMYRHLDRLGLSGGHSGPAAVDPCYQQSV